MRLLDLLRPKPKAQWADLRKAATRLVLTGRAEVRGTVVYLFTEQGFSAVTFLASSGTILLQYATSYSRNPRKILNTLVMYFSNGDFWNKERTKHRWGCLHYHLE